MLKLSTFRDTPGLWKRIDDPVFAGYLEIMYLGHGWLLRHREHRDEEHYSGPGDVSTMTFVPDIGGDVL